MSKLPSIVILTALILGVATNSAVAAEDPDQFVLKYYQAKAAAKTPLDTKNWLSARVRAKQKDSDMKGPDAAMMMMLMKTMMDQEPKKVKVTSSKVLGDKATLELAAVEIPQHYRDEAKGATSWSLKGAVVLVKENDNWKVDKDQWTFKTTSKNGNMSETSGVAGPDDGSKQSALGGDQPQSSMFTDFDSIARDKLMKAWKPATTGKQIYALITVASDGKIKELKIRGEKQPQPAAEKEITDLLQSIQPFTPLPEKYQTQPYIWMTFDWSGDGRSVSGPYFSSDPHPDWLREKVGLSAQKN